MNEINIAQGSASIEMIRQRAELLATIREFMADAGILEVETPVLDVAANTDPNINSLVTQVSLPGSSGPLSCYLHTSPEFAMKRLLAAGSGSIYQVCRVFRDSEAGREHRIEFSMLEWYRIGFNHHELMDELDSLLAVLGLPAGQRSSYAEAFSGVTGLDPHLCSTGELQTQAAALGYSDSEADRSVLLDLIFSNAVVPGLDRAGSVFIYDFPACQAALARQDEAGPAQRFELFINGIEIANGYNELTDYIEVNSRFEQENSRRLSRGLPAQPLDQRLLNALQDGMPECAGVALGLDRLLMAIEGKQDINDVISISNLH